MVDQGSEYLGDQDKEIGRERISLPDATVTREFSGGETIDEASKDWRSDTIADPGDKLTREVHQSHDMQDRVPSNPVKDFLPIVFKDEVFSTPAGDQVGKLLSN